MQKRKDANNMSKQVFNCSVAGDNSYYLKNSQFDSRNWYIKNELTGSIVWNGAFDTASQAIEAAELDGFDFNFERVKS
jgi:hypothetical protein